MRINRHCFLSLGAAALAAWLIVVVVAVLLLTSLGTLVSTNRQSEHYLSRRWHERQQQQRQQQQQQHRTAAAIINNNLFGSDQHAATATTFYTACDLSSTIRFTNWYSDTFTDAPVLFPRNDEELQAIVVHIRNYNNQNRNTKVTCRIRVRGSGQSEGGMIVQKQENTNDTSGTDNNHVVVIHLQNYTPPDAWNMILDEDKARVRVSAGTSLLHVMAYVRPRGYIVSTNAALFAFNVGGYFANPSTHGCTIGARRTYNNTPNSRPDLVVEW